MGLKLLLHFLIHRLELLVHLFATGVLPRGLRLIVQRLHLGMLLLEHFFHFRFLVSVEVEVRS